MTVETISEPAFLITELRYTLGQLHVQVLDLDESTRAGQRSEGRTINMILDDMLRAEDTYQQRYGQLLGSRIPDSAEQEIPLPVNAEEASPGKEHAFEEKRAQTIAMLEQAGENWSQELLDLVREQVQADRRATTEIAECRKSFFAEDQRPDLDQPLTTHPEPSQLAEETGSHQADTDSPAR